MITQLIIKLKNGFKYDDDNMYFKNTQEKLEI